MIEQGNPKIFGFGWAAIQYTGGKRASKASSVNQIHTQAERGLGTLGI
jgi:hypothetical protein